MNRDFNQLEYSNISADIWRYVTFIFSFVVLMFALSCIIGYVGYIDALIRYAPNTRSISYIAIACFFISGIAILAALANMRFLSISLSILIMLISVIMGYFGILDFNTELAKMDPVRTNEPFSVHPCYFPINSAICFILASIILFSANCNKNLLRCNIVCTTFSMILLTLAIIFSLGYILNFPQLYDWYHQLPMSMPAAFGLVFLAIALLSLSVYKAIVTRVEVLHYYPLIGSGCVLLTSLILAVEISELYQVNNAKATALPMLTLFLGMFISLSIAALWYIARVALSEKKNALGSKSLMHAVLDATEDGVIAYDLHGDIVDFNKKFIKMWHLTESQLQKMNRHDVVTLMSQAVMNKADFISNNQVQLKNPTNEFIYEIDLKCGNIIECSSKPYAINNITVGRVHAYKDVTTHKKLEQQLMHRANYDDLTDLPNRACIQQLLYQEIVKARQNLASIGVFLVDISKFSLVNDTLGRNKSDLLLQIIAANIKDSLSMDCTMGRISADAFLIISTVYNSHSNYQILIDTIFKIFETNFDIGSREIKLSCSIGVAFYPNDGQDVDILLANADAALIQAKSKGFGTYQYYTEKLHELTLKRIDLEARLHNAIELEQFVVYFQPVIDLRTELPIGVEALVRWKTDDGNIIPPMEFIPIAEEIGLINKIGDLVFTKVCEQLKIWNNQGLKNLTVAINASPKQFLNHKFISHVHKVIEEYDVNPDNIELELTETSLISTSSLVDILLRDLNKLGIKTVIDDFGAGYSSFNYVKRFAISKVKIDKIFIDGLTNGASEKEIVKAMIAMSHSINYTIVAEGVETKEQLRILQDLGCDECQGFYFAKPMTAMECTEYLLRKLMPV